MNGLTRNLLTELLVLRAQGGERDAIDLLVLEWNERLLNHAARMTGDEDGAKDVVQEAWLGILRNLQSLEDPERFGAWAYRIVSLKSAEWIRKRARHRRLEQGQPDGQREETLSATGNADNEVRLALRRLPADQRAILELRYVEGFRINQIAEALAIAPGTVKSRLFHARNQLRAILDRRTP